MANDRLIIKCRHCHDERLFVKYYPTVYAGGSGMGYCAPVQSPRDACDFENWIQLHLFCAERKNKRTADLEGDHVFEIYAESGDNKLRRN